MTLPTLFDITTLAEHHAEVSKAFELGTAVQLNGAGVERVDAAAVQLLVAATLYARSRGLVCEIVTPSAALIDAAVVLGVGGVLGFAH